MADLPPSIGFEDEPVILLRYTTLDDSLPDSKKLFSKGHRNRIKSDSSITNAPSNSNRKRNIKSSVSSLSDGSSFDMNDGERAPLSKEELSDQSLHSREPKHSLKSLEEEERKGGERGRENGRHSKNGFKDDKASGTRSCSQESSSSSLSSPTKSGHSKRKKSFSIEVEPTSKVVNLERELAARESEIANLRSQLKETTSRNSPPQITILGPEQREEIDTALGPEHREINTTLSLEHRDIDTALGPEHREINVLGPEQRNIQILTTGSVQIEPVLEQRETNSEPMFNSHRTTLHRLLEEQQISTRLKSTNTDLRIKVVTLEGEVDRLHQQNLFQLQQLEQATTSLAAFNSAHSGASAVKPKKKSFFGLRRSGRKGSMGMGGGKNSGSKSSIEQSPQLQRPAHSSSHLSLEGSFSEHDISSLLTRKSVGGSPQTTAMTSIDGEVLQSKLRLSLEEKAELVRQLDSLKDELRHQEERAEELLRNTVEKNEFLSVVVRLEETQQALALLTREKELVESETEGLRYELETLRGERDNLIASLKGKEVKAVLKEKQEMDFLRSENKALMSEVRTLINNSDGLETSLSQLKREMVARDVRGHELKLKIKRLDSENLKLKSEMASLREELNSAHQREALVSPTSTKFQTPTSPPRKNISDSTIVTLSPPSSLTPPSSTPSSTSSPNKTAIVKPVQQFSSIPAPKKPFHERAQSEDLTAVNPATTPLQMVRTSSGGTKFVAVQVTLPTLENAKVLDKSLSVPSLVKQENLLSSSGGEGKTKRKNSDSTLGTFINSYSPSSPKPAVNSLVKMFETGTGMTPPTTITEINREDESGVSFSVGPPVSQVESQTTEGIEESADKPIVKSVMSSGKPPLAKSLRTRRHSSSSSIKEEQERKKSDDESRIKKREEEAKKKEEMRERQRKEHEAKERQRKEEKMKKEQEKQRKEQETKEKRERQRKEQEAKERERREMEAKEKERKEQERRELEMKEKERREQEAKERERKEREAREKERKEQEAREREERERQQEKERKEKEEQEKREQELAANKRIQQEEERRKREEMMADRSQTWPPKSDHTPNTPSTNTLPCKPNEPPNTIKTTPIGITKPKPPPTTGKRASLHQTLPIAQDSSLTGVVANLRSSWEKKSQSVAQPTPHIPLVKTASVPYRMGAFATPPLQPTQLQATVRPLVKTGSGPPGTIISSPSDQKLKSPISLTRVAHMTPNHVTPPTLGRVDSEPFLQTTPPVQQQVTQQNGHVNFRRFPKASSVERTSSGSSGEVILRNNAPPTNGHSSPRLSTRPASLYVSSNSSPSPTSPVVSFGTPTSEKRLSSLISRLQVMESSTSTTTTTTSTVGSPSNSSGTTVQPTVSPILPRYGTSNNMSTSNTSNVKARSQSFQSSPKPLQRAVSLASPLDRRSKKTMLLRWCQLMTQEYDNIAISNFGESFSDGLAFCALLHHFVPDRIPYDKLDHVDQKRNFEIAFTVAESVGIPSLLDIDDMVEMAIPDWMSVMTYVSYIYNHFAKKD